MGRFVTRLAPIEPGPEVEAEVSLAVVEPPVAVRAAGLDRLLDTATRRVQSMDTYTLFEWTDASVGALGKAVSEMRKGSGIGTTTSPPHEAWLAARTVLMAVEELVARVSASGRVPG